MTRSLLVALTQLGGTVDTRKSEKYLPNLGGSFVESNTGEANVLEVLVIYYQIVISCSS